MLVDINLLPRKTKKKPKLFLFFIPLLILALILGGLLYWKYTLQKEQVQSLENEILQVKDAAASLEIQLQNTETTNSADQLQQVIDWTEAYPIDTVFVLKHLIGLLPERGYFQQFTYSEEGTIQLSIRFDTSREAADYLTELTKSKFISSAQLTSITAAEITETTTTTTGTENKTETTTGTENKTGTTTGTENKTGTTTGTENKTGTTTGTENKTGTTTGTENKTGMTTGTEYKTETTTNVLGGQYLPRYIGLYEIKLNDATLKEATTVNQRKNTEKWRCK